MVLTSTNPTVVHHHPAGVAESYAAAAAAAARLTPAFSFYRPDSIPFASFYPPPPTHHHPAAYAPHFSPYYRGFALLPPPGSGYAHTFLFLDLHFESFVMFEKRLTSLRFLIARDSLYLMTLQFM